VTKYTLSLHVFRKKQPLQIFYTVRISILLAILFEILIQIGYYSKSYARKQK